MQKSSFHILFGMIASMWLSVLYFLSLTIHLPVILTLAVFIGITIPAYVYIIRRIDIIAGPQPVRTKWLQLLILAAGVALIVRSVSHQLYIHGSNDALGMWNYYARFLSADNWAQLFTINGYYHPNHPIGLSSLIASGWRLTGTYSELWPIAVSLLSLLVIPVLIFTEIWKESVPLAVFSLILFATDLSYHGYSFAQIADLPLALSFLGAFITMNSYQQHKNDLMIFLCAALLGCCLWLKNEGMLLVLIFGIFYAKDLLGKRLRYSLAGLLPFLITLLVYKLLYATPTDLLKQSSQSLGQMLTNKAAYGKIFLYLRETLHSHFYVLQAAFLLYIIIQAIRRQWLQRKVVCLTICLGGMLSVYLITPTDLDWQLGTSLSRVLFELMPSFVFSLAFAFARMRSSGLNGIQ